MATNKTFTVTGVSTLNGKTKIRFANDVMRIKILDKNGHQDVELVDLPKAMTKAEIAVYLTESGFGADKPAVKDAIAYIARKNPSATNNIDKAEVTTVEKTEAVTA